MVKTKNTTRYSIEQQNEVFEYWYNHKRNWTATAEHCGVTRVTLSRWAKKYDWEKRADKIVGKIADGIDRKIVGEALSNVEVAKRCLSKEVQIYLANKKKTADLRAIVVLMKYIDEALGHDVLADAIREANAAAIPYDPALALEVANVLKKAAEEAKGADDDSEDEAPK